MMLFPAILLSKEDLLFNVAAAGYFCEKERGVPGVAEKRRTMRIGFRKLCQNQTGCLTDHVPHQDAA